MLDTLRAWLNGNRDYNTGVALYSQLGDNKELFSLLVKGKNEFRERRLQEELLIICSKLKSNPSDKPKANTPAAANKLSARNKQNTIAEQKPAPVLKNAELYNSCKSAADKKYKEVMNLRARLFALADADPFTDPNTQEKINSREKLALDVVRGQHEYSRLYDIADHVKEHGCLPDQPATDENKFKDLPDHLVKKELDNARKAYNKLKDKKETPARVALMQNHKKNIEILEARWHSLQQK